MKILGVDLGTNSIGLTLRESDTFSWYGVYTFKKGVGEGKSGEFSLAGERTKHRSSRRLYNARRYRKWETLKVLIENDYCPLSLEELEKWKHYKKEEGRIYPIDNEFFNQWIKFDFNGDGISDYSSPYQLRRELIHVKLDTSERTNRHKIGRAFYHIAQRRGFKSSRKTGTSEVNSVYQGSKETGTIGRNEYQKLIILNGSLGAALAHLEDIGVRVRNRYTLRSDYLEEVNKIFLFQNIEDEKFSENIKKAIFFQRPLRSQKGLVGKCTLEPTKARCPVSHPKFEEYRAWSFINNIKYRTRNEDPFTPLPLELKEKLYYKKFFHKSKRDFKFIEIRKFIYKFGGINWELNYSEKMDNISIPSCYVSARLKAAFGDNWQDFKKSVVRTNSKGKVAHRIYTIDDIWHILFHFEDEEYFIEFLNNILELENNQIDELNSIFKSLPIGYANLSLKAISIILPFLREGFIYSEAVIFAKIPEIIGTEVFNDNKNEIISAIQRQFEINRYNKTIVNITNSLIFKYHSLDFNEKFAYKDFTYQLDELDFKNIEKTTRENLGNTSWLNLSETYKKNILSDVSNLYQAFFYDHKREHIKQPHLVSQVIEFLYANFDINQKMLERIYHPSQTEIYPKKEGQKYLLSPKTGAFKNPMAYKTLYKLRQVINYLIEVSLIDEETRIVIEVARNLNDSNKRWAIEQYQRNRESENRDFSNAISELLKDPEFNGVADPTSDSDSDKFRLWLEQSDNYDEVTKEIRNIETKKGLSPEEKDIQKYRLWKEQNCICMYTGRVIKLTDLFDQNIVDFEHTIPRSISFDNSMANLTVCYADYNRNIKGKKMPSELPNYENESHGYTPIKPRLEKWKNKVNDLYEQIESYRIKSRIAKDKEAKDNAIRQRHLRQMEYDYWKNKYERFVQTEITSGFINSQLTDTQIITKYAYHYLKTVFRRVDIQKASNTAEFRKIFRIKPNDIEKDRGKHYHHAVDAAVLTLIPPSQKQKEILRKSYEHWEKYGTQYNELPFPEFRHSMIEEIERNILINNLEDKDRALIPGKRIVRKRGRIEWIDKENKTPKIAQGDSVRGELHKQKFYGKIKIAAKDGNGKIIRDEEGSIIYEQVNNRDLIQMVIRKPIEDVDFNKKEDIIDIHLAEFLNQQLLDGKSKNELKDFQGNTVRRLRCRAKSGRGYMIPENATVLKEQTYKSKKEYKNYYYVDSGDNYMFGLYENENGKKVVSINLFDAVKHSLNQNIDTKDEIFKSVEPVLIGSGKKEKEAKLIHIFMPGQKVIFYTDKEDYKSELLSLTNEELSHRLYYVKTLADAKQGRILLQHHLEARNDDELLKSFPSSGKRGVDGFSKFSIDFTAPRLLLTQGNLDFVIEEKDFKMYLDGKIKFNF